jgi:multiple sugar transport system substrate-binding protein
VQAKVTIIPASNFVQKLGTAASSGAGPDVSSIDLVYAPYFASAGALTDITELADSLPYKDSLSPSHRRLSTYEDATYALPFTAEASAVYYNKDLFKKAGLDPEKPPTTYAEMRAAAAKIRALGPDYYGFTFAGACGGCNVFEFAPHIWASGGDVLSEDGSKATLDSPQVTEALQFYKDMWTDGSVPSAAKNDAGTQQTPLFSSGKVGMVTLGAFAIPSIEKAKINFGVTPIPGKDGNKSSFAGGDVISVISGTKNQAGAEDFVKWATDEEAQTFLAKNGSVPVRTDLVGKIYSPQGPAYKVFGELMGIGKTPYSVVENPIFNDNNGPWVKMINDAVFGPDLAAAQANGQKAAQSLIDGG